jgi:RNA polymerase sigma factor (sigma-70 family)
MKHSIAGTMENMIKRQKTLKELRAAVSDRAQRMAMSESENRELDTFLKSCQKRLRAFIYKHLPAKGDVEDVVQDVLYQYVRANSLMQPVEQAMAWMLKVARNKIIDLSRKKTEQPMPEDADGAFFGEMAEILFGQANTPEDEYLASLFWEELEDALAELPDAQREAFEMTELQGYSFKQLSETTGVPLNTLLSRKHSAVLHLRERLQALYEEIGNT